MLSSHRLVVRAKIVLKAAAGEQNKKIVADLGLAPSMAATWRKRFLEGGLAALEHEKPRPGRPKTVTPEIERKILEAAQEPPMGATHWSQRRLAEKLGVSPSTVRDVWKRYDLRPHIVKRFKLSKDKRFEEKVVDIVGLYLDPPVKSAVFCVDEKTQIQALDRTRPLLAVRPGIPEHQTHDYKRNGRTNLYAALNPHTGVTLHQFHTRSRHQEFIKFLREIDANTPADLDLHIVADNSATHKTPKVKAWLAKHPRFHMHFSPTSSSWMNLVERIFGSLTAQQIRRGTFESVDALETAIKVWFYEQNDRAKPFKWTKTAQEIIRKVEKYRGIFRALH